MAAPSGSAASFEKIGMKARVLFGWIGALAGGLGPALVMAQAPAQLPTMALPELPMLRAPAHDPNIDPNIDYGALRKIAQNYLLSGLIDPQSAQFEWPNGFTRGWFKPLFGQKVEGNIVCGYVNAKNRMGGYVGRRPFMVIIDRGLVKLGQIGAESGLDPIGKNCRNMGFPPPQPGMLDAPPNVARMGEGISIADEIAKLAVLKERGIISQEEFEAQKRKLLGN